MSFATNSIKRAGPSTIASQAISMFLEETVPVEWQFWALVLFVVGVTMPLVVSQLEDIFSPKIRLDRWAVEPNKKIFETFSRRILFWQRKYRVLRQFQAAYIEVYNEPKFGNKTIERVIPQIAWMNDSGDLIAKNNGRWWLSHVHAYVDTSELQMVNLWPNGQRRRLHFARHEDGQLYIWHRTYDNKEPMEQMKHDDYEVAIELNSINGRKARFDFLVKSTPIGMSIERLKWTRKILRRLGRR